MNSFFLRCLVLFFLPVLSASADTLAKITERGSIVLAYRESSVPFSYLDGPGKPIGFGVDIANKVAEAIRQASGKKELRIEYQAVTSQNQSACPDRRDN